MTKCIESAAFHQFTKGFILFAIGMQVGSGNVYASQSDWLRLAFSAALCAFMIFLFLITKKPS